jgi:hypothetical protein
MPAVNRRGSPGEHMHPSVDGRVLVTQGRVTITLLRGGLLCAEERDRNSCRETHTRHACEWSLWRHEHGFVLCPQLTPWCTARFAIEGDPAAFLEVGVQDCRRRHAPAVDRLVALTKAGQPGGVVPFIIADDGYDAYEALSAAKAFFHRPLGDDQDVTLALASSNIVDWHDQRMLYQGDGSFDVAAGMWHRPPDPGESHDDWIKAVGERYKHSRRTRCIVIARPENLGRMQGSMSPNFPCLLDSAVDRVWAWGCSAAVIGSWDSWLALVRAGTGPLEHSYELVHLPASTTLDPEFAFVMMAKFRENFGLAFEREAISSDELSLELAEMIWAAARNSKDLALAMIETVVGASEHNGLSHADASSIRRFVADGCRLPQPAQSRSASA